MVFGIRCIENEAQSCIMFACDVHSYIIFKGDILWFAGFL
jgi:hypothetical protein